MFQRPEAFLLLLLFFLVLWIKEKRKESVHFPNLAAMKNHVPQASWVKRNLVPLLGVLAFSSFVIALVDPMYTVQKSREVKETRLIVLVEDMSGSMDDSYVGSSDGSGFDYESNKPSEPYMKKCELALDGAKKFASLRLEDHIALIAFADYAKLVSPFTIDYNIVSQKLDDLRPASKYAKDMDVGSGTNAAEAIWLVINLFINQLPKKDRPSVGELMDMRASLYGSTEKGELYIPPSLRGKDFGKGKVLVLLSDGDFYIEDKGLNVLRAIKLMRHLGVKSYFLLINKSINSRVEQAVTLADSKDLETAGVIFNLEPNLSNVQLVYSLINELEKTKIVIEKVDSKKSGSEFFVLLGLAFLLGHIFLKYNKKFRKPEL